MSSCAQGTTKVKVLVMGIAGTCFWKPEPRHSDCALLCAGCRELLPVTIPPRLAFARIFFRFFRPFFIG